MFMPEYPSDRSISPLGSALDAILVAAPYLAVLLSEANANPCRAAQIEMEIVRHLEWQMRLADRPSVERPRLLVERILDRASHISERAFSKDAFRRFDTEKQGASRSGKSRASRRIDPRRDAEIFRYICGLLTAKQPVQVTSTSAHTVRSAELELARSRLEGTRIIPKVGLPHWDHADRQLKMLGWGMASWDMNARPFTLRVHTTVMAKARDDKRGIARHLQDRLTRHLRTRLPDAPAFWFAIEMGAGDEPHLHGAIVVPPGREKEVKNALRAAGGPWTASKQLKFSDRGTAATWVSYSTKWMYGTAAKLQDDNIIAATNGMRAAAKEWYQTARKECRTIYAT